MEDAGRDSLNIVRGKDVDNDVSLEFGTASFCLEQSQGAHRI